MAQFSQTQAELLQAVRLEMGEQPVYLVGGAVRDLLLGREAHDLDFTLAGDTIRLARRVADRLGAGFFLLDAERRIGRVVHRPENGEIFFLDFVPAAGDSLLEDLSRRDFTVNAMALTMNVQEELVDPLGGARDLHGRCLRMCRAGALLADPIRVLRGVRQANNLRLQMDPETLAEMKPAARLLGQISAERTRDELFRILESPRLGAALRVLDVFGALERVLPEVTALQGVAQSAPHVLDVWEHSLAAADRLAGILQLFNGRPGEEKSDNLLDGLLLLQLGKFRTQIEQYLGARINPLRSHSALLALAMLYHDSGKPAAWTRDESGRIRAFGHEEISMRLVRQRGQYLQLSSPELDRLAVLAQQHMRIHHLAQSGHAPSRRSIYHFFRDCGEAGVDLVWLSLADTLATYGSGLPVEVWNHELQVCRALLEAWWEQPQKAVRPVPLVNGLDIMAEFSLQPGPRIGRLLEAVREGQAVGSVTTREEALAFAQNLLKNEGQVQA